jgi:hypothetical protein
MSALPKNPTEILDTVHDAETDVRRKARVDLAHRRALHDLAWVTLRYQVHNEFSALREGEIRIRARNPR